MYDTTNSLFNIPIVYLIYLFLFNMYIINFLYVIKKDVNKLHCNTVNEQINIKNNKWINK